MKTPDDLELLIQNPGMTRRDALKGAGALALAGARPLALGGLLAGSGGAMAKGLNDELRNATYNATSTKHVGTLLFEYTIDSYNNTTTQLHTNVSAAFYHSGSTVNVYRRVQISDASHTTIADTYYSWGSGESNSATVDAWGPYHIKKIPVSQTALKATGQGRRLNAIAMDDVVDQIEDPQLRAYVGASRCR